MPRRKQFNVLEYIIGGIAGAFCCMFLGCISLFPIAARIPEGSGSLLWLISPPVTIPLGAALVVGVMIYYGKH